MQLQVEYRYLQNEWLIPILSPLSKLDQSWLLTDTGFMNKDELVVALSL